MRGVLRLVRGMVNKSLERDRSSERYVKEASRLLWPWQESWLLPLVCLLAFLDYVSTYAILELSGRWCLYEGGALAGWALRVGGFLGLFLVDVAAVVALSLAAITMRFLYFKLGFKGFGRAAFVILLVPYAVVAVAAVVNNLLLAFIYI